MKKITKIFKALSDLNRLRIIKMLEIRPLCVCEITEILQLANSTVSKHLSILREADLILDDKDGKWVNYQLNTNISDSVKKQVLLLLKDSLPDDDMITGDREKVINVDRNIICNT